MPNTIYDFQMPMNNGEIKELSDYKGKVLLIVNTASKCGFTPQYDGLQSLYTKYKSQGLEILGFPCDQFGHQEPGSDSEIEQFCSLNFNVDFPLFKKSDVNGKDASPLYEFLKAEAPGVLGSKSVKWNFTKFLVNKEGKVLARYAPKTKPEAIQKDIEALL
ncbi:MULTISPECIES: glutathione peroxidase [Alteromonadaceae]|uniref:glutathione peroxidase n=1 Tax=Alteromonadaceae TaxID=72275 RepID=UPI001C089B45|nr:MULTISPECIES: glutathione peroxidase [Aliiglaciecola]MBU2876149.1 glutathione peroxidase [Aliiglaciecola lipolytica]MDO6712243.1 glutathione peroxidase [Aliiglaciecola sp. 2_MG-2023]MDO6753519.1 glutathione peroxidase [Aliiglaciecola sp. 1_MG-2023]